MSAFFDDCGIKLEYCSPADNSHKVPVNAVITLVFLSDGELLEDSLQSSESFLLERIEKQSKSSSKKDSGDAETASTENDKERIKVPFYSKIDEKRTKLVKVEKKDGIEEKYQTVLYFIPIPEKKSITPLKKNADYEFTIGELEDEAGKIFMGKVINFSTVEKTDFKFEKSRDKVQIANQKAIKPSGLYVQALGNELPPNTQKIEVEFTKPVNPIRLAEYSKLLTVCKLDADSGTGVNASQGTSSYRVQTSETARRMEYIENRAVAIMQQMEGTKLSASEEEKLLLELDKLDQEYGALSEKIKEEEQQTDTASGDEEAIPRYANRTGGSSKGLTRDSYSSRSSGRTLAGKQKVSFGCSEEMNSNIGFSVRLLENFTNNASNMQNSRSKSGETQNEKSKFITLDYTRFAIVANTPFSEGYKYELTLAAKGNKTGSGTMPEAIGVFPHMFVKMGQSDLMERASAEASTAYNEYDFGEYTAIDFSLEGDLSEE